MGHWRKKQQPNLVFLPGEPHGQYEKQKDTMLEDEAPRLKGVQYATMGEQRMITNFKIGFSSKWTKNLQMSELGFEKAEEPEINC